MSEFLERTQSNIIAKLNHEMKKLRKDYDKEKQDKNNLIGILVGAMHQYGDAKAEILRIRKKHMVKANPGWMLFPEIDHASKDLIVRFLDKNTVPKKGGVACQSTTTNAEDVEKNSKPSTDEQITNQKNVQDAKGEPSESSVQNNTSKV